MDNEKILLAIKTEENLESAIDHINSLNNSERLLLREYCENNGAVKLPRNLYYNYKTQQWI